MYSYLDHSVLAKRFRQFSIESIDVPDDFPVLDLQIFRCLLTLSAQFSLKGSSKFGLHLIPYTVSNSVYMTFILFTNTFC